MQFNVTLCVAQFTQRTINIIANYQQCN